MDIDIKLTNLLLVFFQRTNFIDVEKVCDFVMNNIYEFQDSKKEIMPTPPISFDYIPRIQLRSNKYPFLIIIYNNKIDFIANGLFNKSQYTDVIGTFTATAKLLIKLVASRENICGRIGFVNDSFLVTDDPTQKIKNKYIKDSQLKESSNIFLSYTMSSKVSRFDINIINTIQPGKLNINPPQDGLLIHRDVNIKDMQISIKDTEINRFLDGALTLLSEKAMRGIIYE